MASTPPATAYSRLADWFERTVWLTNVAAVPAARRIVVQATRVMVCVGRDIWAGQLTLRAMSLVYTTLLSLIPLFAISFSVLKGFGVHREIEPFLISFLAPLGDRAEEIAVRLVEFIDNTSVSVLGYAGVALLFFAVVSLMQKIERAFNYVWRVTRDRTFTERIRDYLTLVIVGPTLMFAATGIWASILGTDAIEELTSVAPLGWVISVVTRLLPVLLIILAFAFIYAFVPNTKVRWRPALTGGIVAGLLWNLGGLGFAFFVGSSANYPAIYSSFATAMFFMIWLYLAWMILLIGGSISFYLQHPPGAGRESGRRSLSNRTKEKLALAVAAAIGKRFYAGQPPHTAASLTEQLGLPAHVVDAAAAALESRGLIVRAGEAASTYVPARAWESVSIAELLRLVRAHGEEGHLTPDAVTDSSIDEAWRRFESALGASVDDVSLKDVSLREGARSPK